MTEQNINETGVPQEAGPAAPPENSNPNMKWYIIHSYSGFERKVKESLESRIQAFGLQEKIGKVVIPTEPVTEIRGGKKYTVEKMFYPGYVLVQMDLTGFRTGGEGDHVWHVVKSRRGAPGFLPPATDPSPLPEEEATQTTNAATPPKHSPRLKQKLKKKAQEG